jgi:hypothetical protein
MKIRGGRMVSTKAFNKVKSAAKKGRKAIVSLNKKIRNLEKRLRAAKRK